MNNQIIYFIGLLAAMTTTSMMATVTSQEHGNATSSSNNLSNYIVNDTILINNTLKNTITNDTNSSKECLSSSAVKNIIINATNKTAFRIGDGMANNESACKIGRSIKPIVEPSKMWYIIQGVPHGYV